MFDNNKHITDSEELNHLLDEAFIELDFTNPKNDIIMQAVSKQVMNADMYTLSQSEKSKLNFKKLLFKYKWGIGIFLGLLASLILYFSYPDNTKNTLTQQYTSSILKESENKPDTFNNTIKSVILINLPNSTIKSEIKQTTDTAIANSEVAQIKQPPQHSLVPLAIPEKLNEDTAFEFPVLTEKEIKNNHKQKRKMIEMLAKQSKEKYARISMGSFIYKRDTISLQGFFMQNAEVTNLEYRTFIYDLIITKKKKEFLAARPNQSQWTAMLENSDLYKHMKDNYFSNPEYNDYPMVNVSKQGAEMYCEWLTIETNKYLKDKGKALINDLRIPTDFEWNYAAQAGKPREYPWGSGFVQNKKGCYYMNFNIQKEVIDSLAFSECNNKAYFKATTSAGLMLGENTLTAKVYSYNPNDFSLFCMSGNVAEMVRVAHPKSPQNYAYGTKGGSWNSDITHTKLTAEDEYNKFETGSPFVGFRPVLSIPRQPYTELGSINREYSEDGKFYFGYPKITDEEKKEILSQKKIMIEQIINNKAKNNFSLIPSGTINYKGNQESITSFYIQTTEVSNLEYRTFIMDVLLQGDTALFQKIKPDQEQWVKRFTKSFNEPMILMYFSHPAYNNYPAVNVSRYGAEMYCKWLTQEVNKVLKEKKQPLIDDIRLPDEQEWVYTARAGSNASKYANGLNTLLDDKNHYLVNYAVITKDSCSYSAEKNTYSVIGKKAKFVIDGGFFTVPCRVYTPNKYGLYCMAGNVSEMIVRKNNTPGTIGGNWYSCDCYLQIEAEDEFPNDVSANPCVGFRPVFSAGSK